MKNERGITLIALVITIIVLLILAAVSISTLTGDNGILSKASGTKLASEQAEILEQLRLEMYEKRLDLKNTQTEIDYLKTKKIVIKEVEETANRSLGKYASITSKIKVATTNAETTTNVYYIIDVTKLVQNPSTGKGDWETGDVYYILNGNLCYKATDQQSKVIRRGIY